MPISLENAPKVFLGINTYSGKDGQRAKYLDSFLSSIAKNTSYPNYDICVYDDCSPQDYIERIIANHPNVRFVKGAQPLVRWHLVRNELLKIALDGDYKYVMLFDDDFEIVQSNWMNHIIGCMENMPEIGILGAFWATLEDGKTRQRQHTPTGFINNNGFEVSTNKFVCGGSWTVRTEVILELGLWPTDRKYDSGNVGADTYYHNLMLEKTKYKLCCTRVNMAKHVGQEFMTGKLANKYNSEEFQKGQRLY